MRTILYNIILALAAIISATGCTHNNGDIGPLFGSWVLDEMTVDSEVADLGEDHTFFQFQGGVIMVKRIDDRHSLLFYGVGSWERDGDVLALNFTHSDDKTEPGEGQYSAPYWLLMTTNSVNRVEILSLDSKRMQLRYDTPDGKTVLYQFRKTH